MSFKNSRPQSFSVSISVLELIQRQRQSVHVLHMQVWIMGNGLRYTLIVMLFLVLTSFGAMLAGGVGMEVFPILPVVETQI